MPIKVDVDDRKLMKGLKDLERKLKQVEEKHTISFEELFPPSFTRKYTDAKNMYEFIRNSGLIPKDKENITQELFENIPDKEFDEHVKSHSRFNSWEEMQSAAVKEWTAKRLGFK